MSRICDCAGRFENQTTAENFKKQLKIFENIAKYVFFVSFVVLYCVGTKNAFISFNV